MCVWTRVKLKKRGRRRCAVLTWTAAARALLSTMPVSRPLSLSLSLSPGASCSVLCTRYSRFSLVGRVERWSGLFFCGGGPPRPPSCTQLLSVSRLACVVDLLRAHVAHLLLRVAPSPPSSQPFSIGLSFCFVPLCARQPVYRTSRPPLSFSRRHSPSARQRASAPVPVHRSRFHMCVRVRWIVCGSLLI